MGVSDLLDSDQYQDGLADSLPGPDPLFKPCPFCGWTEPRMLTVESDADFADDFSVQCLECGACGGNRDNQTDAAVAWNARSCDHRDDGADKTSEMVVRFCLESRTYPPERQAAFLRDSILTLVDPLMNITQRIREAPR